MSNKPKRPCDQNQLAKMIVYYLVGGRDSEYAIEFMDDVAKRLNNRVQITTDGHKAYLEAVEGAFPKKRGPYKKREAA